MRALVLFCFLLLALVGRAQGDSISIYVSDQTNGQPLAGVQIKADGVSAVFYTNQQGLVHWPAAGEGHYHFHLEKKAYQGAEVDLYYPEQVRLQVGLLRTYVELEEAVVEESFGRRGRRKSVQSVENLQVSGAEQAAAASVMDLIADRPGYQQLNTGVGVSKPVIRGLMGNRVAVINEGIKQQGQQWGMDHGLAIDPFQTQRIELIKGPQALQYGSDAIGGVIKFLDPGIPDSGWSGGLQSLFRGNNNTFGNSAYLNYRWEARATQFLRARFSEQGYGDFRVPAETFTYNGFRLPLTDGYLKNTAGSMRSGSIRYGRQGPSYAARYHLSTFQQQLGLFSGATGIPRAYNIRDLGDKRNIGLPNQSVRHLKVQSTQNIKIMGHWLQLDLALQENRREEHSLPHNHGFIKLDSSQTLAIGLRLQTYSLNMDYRWHNAWAEFTVGTNQEVQHNKRQGWEYLIPDYQQYLGDYFLLAEGEWTPEWHWNGGLRWGTGTFQSPRSSTAWWQDPDSNFVRSPGIDRDYQNLAAAFGVAYNPNPRWRYKLNLARTYRVPSVAELASNGVHHGTFRHELGQADLQTEKAWQLDASMAWVSERWLLRFSPFANYFSNFLYLRPVARFSNLPESGQLYRYEQNQALQWGGELYADWHFWKKLHFSSGLEYLWSQNLNSNLPLPFTPPLSTVTTLSWEQENKQNQQWQLAAVWRFSAVQNRTDRNEQATPGYHLFQLKAQFKYRWRDYALGLNLQALNLLDRAYLRHLSRYRILNLPEQGRNLVIGVTFDW